MYCKYCGNEIQPEEAFCGNCGSKNQCFKEQPKKTETKKNIIRFIPLLIVTAILFIFLAINLTANSQSSTKIQKYDASLYNTGITYEQLARTPDNYIGKKTRLSGKVAQVLEGEKEVDLRIAVNNDYNKMLLVVYNPTITKVRILEDDNVTISGTSTGIYTYKATSGTSISVPSMNVDNIELNSSKTK